MLRLHWPIKAYSPDLEGLRVPNQEQYACSKSGGRRAFKRVLREGTASKSRYNYHRGPSRLKTLLCCLHLNAIQGLNAGSIVYNGSCWDMLSFRVYNVTKQLEACTKWPILSWAISLPIGSDVIDLVFHIALSVRRLKDARLFKRVTRIGYTDPWPIERFVLKKSSDEIINQLQLVLKYIDNISNSLPDLTNMSYEFIAIFGRYIAMKHHL